MAAPNRPRAAPAKTAPPPRWRTSTIPCGAAACEVTVSTGNTPAVDVCTAFSVAVMAKMVPIENETYLRMATSASTRLPAKRMRGRRHIKIEKVPHESVAHHDQNQLNRRTFRPDCADRQSGHRQSAHAIAPHGISGVSTSCRLQRRLLAQPHVIFSSTCSINLRMMTFFGHRRTAP